MVLELEENDSLIWAAIWPKVPQIEPYLQNWSYFYYNDTTEGIMGKAIHKTYPLINRDPYPRAFRAPLQSFWRDLRKWH